MMIGITLSDTRKRHYNIIDNARSFAIKKKNETMVAEEVGQFFGLFLGWKNASLCANRN